MNSGSFWAYRAAAELPDNEPDDPIPCRDCGVSPEDVHDGCVEIYDYRADDFLPVPVNPVTGCLCAPEDLEPKEPPNLDELPF